MPRYALFLRGINVGGNKLVPMAELRAMLAAMGYSEPATVLQSGNAVFGGPASPTAAMESRIRTALLMRVGVESECLVRTAKEWQAVVAGNPYPAEAKSDPSHLLVVLLRVAPTTKAMAALRKAIVGRERAEAGGCHLYVVYPDGIGRSKFGLPLIEKCLGTVGTGRNWNTVTRVAELLEC